MEENEELKELELRKDVAIIRPYLKSQGYDFSIKSEYDKFGYHIARKDDIRYLSFGISHYQGEDMFGDFDYKSEYGQIIYDINGNVLLDCIKSRSKNFFFWGGKTETYEEFDSSNIFMDDYALISKLQVADIAYYDIYKLENNKYSLLGKFNESCTKVEKTSSGELFINNWGRLFGVRKLEFVNDLKFKDIMGVNCSTGDLRYDIMNFGLSELKNQIKKTLQNNNLLFAYDYVTNDRYRDREKNATVFTFLDVDGNIASKLYVKSKYEFYTLDVDNNTYEEAKELVKQKLNNLVKKEIAAERRKETRECKLWRKANEEMVESLSFKIEEQPKQKIKTI